MACTSWRDAAAANSPLATSDRCVYAVLTIEVAALGSVRSKAPQAGGITNENTNEADLPTAPAKARPVAKKKSEAEGDVLVGGARVASTAVKASQPGAAGVPDAKISAAK